MIKDFEEFKKYRSRYLDETNAKESAKLKEEMAKFRKANPEIFDKLSQEKWVGSLTDPQ
ncbi:hypothetical protein MARBORIA2_14850 [Methanobrevibacter arboriphilus]|jgi:hypothetical protein|uniref:hypothetical protein n=1 Tax=Methanobrevibacter arboriphilus TaxID=39441 RepID=UPI0022ED6D7C|nr:hypothetical protein [Methanobrevibacter arboriphilus]GLI12395.1 hypothetical protein MARBORIA2_14850 [Methanobrevibacter arboriphilus]